MGRKTKKRRQSHGSAWHWKQSDCWYFTRPGTKERVPLFDEQGERLRGKENRQVAEIALAREKLTWDGEAWKGNAVHYRMSPENAPCLTAAAINCCTLANNHFLD